MIFSTLLNAATSKQPLVSGTNYDLSGLADRIRQFLAQRVAENRDSDALAAARGQLVAELIALLTNYYGRSA